MTILDPEGNVVSERAYPVSGRAIESGGWLEPAEDGGLYLCAYSEPRATGVDSDVAVFRLDSGGVEIWRDLIGRDSDDVYRGLDFTGGADGGCAVLFSEGYPGEGGARLSHYTQDGENDWDQTFDDRQDVFPTGVQSLSDGYIVLLVHLWKDSTFVMKLS